jgi:hypothetical protein
MPTARRRLGAQAALILLVALSLSLGTHAQVSVPSADDPAPGQVLNVAVHPFSNENETLVEHKIPLMEVFTATWCPPCRPAHGATERLMAERSPSLGSGGGIEDPVRLGLLSYHPFPDVGGEDPFGIPEGHNRLAQKHNVFWFPSAYFDGILEDAPQTRTMSVDVGLEDILYNSYKGLIERAETTDPPFVLSVQSQQADEALTWDIEMSLTATRSIDMPLFVQGVLWEDHVHFPGSSEVDIHRMVVRAMSPTAEAPASLEAGETWSHSFTLTAPRAVDPERAGVTLIVEAPWGEERDERAGWFFAFALFVAGGTAVTAAWQVRSKEKKRNDRKTGNPP